MSQDNRYINGGDPVVAESVVRTETYTTTAAPVYETVEPVRHPSLLPLLLAPLLGLLSLFLPFAHIGTAWTRTLANGATEEIAANRAFSFWNIANGHHGILLALLLATAVLALIAWVARADWARYVAGILGLISGIWLLVNSLFRFSHIGLGNFFGVNQTAALGSGIGRWIMALAGLALLATALWALLRKAGGSDDTAAVGRAAYNN